MRRISNSEVATWLTCRRQYFYAFDMGIAPKKQFHNNPSGKVSTLAVGTFGHQVLSVYYEALKYGESVETAIQGARDYLTHEMMHPTIYPMEVVAATATILERYWSFYAHDDFKKYEVIDVEKEYDIPLTDDYSYVFRFDLLLKERGTPKIGLTDHKFKYDFFSDEAISLSGQLPKYIGALRYNEINPSFVFINQIRAKPAAQNWGPKDFFKRSSVVPSNFKVTQAIREQIIASQEISEWRDQSFEVKQATALRSMDSFPNPCGRCPFNLICRMEYDGGNITLVVKKDFGPNSYNYNKDEVL
jgi:hypothetical protein